MKARGTRCPGKRSGVCIHQQLFSRWFPPSPKSLACKQTPKPHTSHAQCGIQARSLWQTCATSSRDTGPVDSSGVEQQQQRRRQQQEEQSQKQTQEQQYKEWCTPLLPATRRQLRAAAAQQPQLVSVPFLFWLQDAERTAKRTNGLVWVLPAEATQQHRDAARLHPPPDATTSGPTSTGFVLLSAGPSTDAISTSTEDVAGTSDCSEALYGTSTTGPVEPHTNVDQGGRRVHVQPAQLSKLASELVAIREQQDQEAAQRLLPALASSAAYDSLARWRQESGAGAGGFLPTPGLPQLPVEQLYRITEAQERDLRDGNSTWAGASGGLGPRSKRQSSPDSKSPVQNFASGAYGMLAANAMQRVRARFMGFEDGAGTAAPVLDTLLWSAVDSGERAELLHAACTPPGIPYQPPPKQLSTAAGAHAEAPQHRADSTSSSFLAGSSIPQAAGEQFGMHLGAYARSCRSANSSASQFFARRQSTQAGAMHQGPDGHATSIVQPQAPPAADGLAAGTMLVTTPKALVDEVMQRLAAIQANTTAASEAPLPCGSNMQQALEELQQIITEYEASVWSAGTEQY